MQAWTSGKQSLKPCSFSNCNPVSLSVPPIANFKIKEATISVFKLSTKIEDCLVACPTVFEEEIDINAVGDECYRECFHGVPYQGLKHKN